MRYRNLDDLVAFLAVARERSFTRAAAKLGVSQSTLSHAVRRLEDRLELSLLARTTRNVSLTSVGQQLAYAIGPRLDNVAAELDMLRGLRDKPVGTVRLTATDHAFNRIVKPKLPNLLAAYPDINVEVSTNYAVIDIVEQRFDGGIRAGGHIEQDMIAVRVAPDFRFVVVGSPSYFATMPEPTRPEDLNGHNCINLRPSTDGGLRPWTFEKDGETIDVRVKGQLTFNSLYPILDAALDGQGLAYVPDDVAGPYLADGRLREVLGDWNPEQTGLHLFYPSRRHPSPAFALVVDALRYRSQPSR